MRVYAKDSVTHDGIHFRSVSRSDDLFSERHLKFAAKYTEYIQAMILFLTFELKNAISLVLLHAERHGQE